MPTNTVNRTPISVAIERLYSNPSNFPNPNPYERTLEDYTRWLSTKQAALFAPTPTTIAPLPTPPITSIISNTPQELVWWWQVILSAYLGIISKCPLVGCEGKLKSGAGWVVVTRYKYYDHTRCRQCGFVVKIVEDPITSNVVGLKFSKPLPPTLTPINVNDELFAFIQNGVSGVFIGNKWDKEIWRYRIGWNSNVVKLQDEVGEWYFCDGILLTDVKESVPTLAQSTINAGLQQITQNDKWPTIPTYNASWQCEFYSKIANLTPTKIELPSHILAKVTTLPWWVKMDIINAKRAATLQKFFTATQLEKFKSKVNVEL